MIPKNNIGNSINELNINAYDLILNSGKETGNRNEDELGRIFVEYEVNNILLDPRQRHLNLKGRKSNIFALIGESIWVMSGREDVEYLMNFIPRAINYSDDGKTWRASYGERIFSHGQLQGITEIFKTDGKNTRRATLSIYDPSKDSPESLLEVYGLRETKDIPCNQWVNFYVDDNNFFNMKIGQRSGDAIWGAMSINVTEFSILMESVFNSVKELYPEILLGTYNHSVTNFHLYEKTCSQARDVLDFKKEQILSEFEILPIKTPSNIYQMKSFFLEMSKMIENGEFSTSLFEDFGVEEDKNLLVYYFFFCSLYVKLKKEGCRGQSKKVIQDIDQKFIDFFNSDNGFAIAMRENVFRNFSF